MDCEYDVFISYCRDDYYDKKEKKVISNNAISAIIETFKQNNITFWIDKDDIYHGQNFANEIYKGIDASKILLFISSTNSNSDETLWPKREICEANIRKKYIISCKIDDSDYDTTIASILNPRDFFEFTGKKEELQGLVCSINKYKAEWAKKQRKIEKEVQIAEINNKIESFKYDFSILTQQQQAILKDIYRHYDMLGVKAKKCPVCEMLTDIRSSFCERCGWQFHPLKFKDDEISKTLDRKRFRLIKANWKIINSVVDSNSEIETLKNEVYGLKEALETAESEKMHIKNIIEKQKKEVDKLVLNKERIITALEKQLVLLTNKLQKLSADFNEKEIIFKKSFEEHEKEIVLLKSQIKSKDNEIESLKAEKNVQLLGHQQLKDKQWVFENIINSSKNKDSIFLSDNRTAINFIKLIKVVKEHGILLKKTDFDCCQKVDDIVNVIVSAAKRT